MESVSKALFEYAGRDGNTIGYPPAYGYLRPEAAGMAVDLLADSDHVLDPYTSALGIHGIEAVYQIPSWAISFDTNRDGRLGLMEYLPVGVRSEFGEDFSFSTTLYTGENSPRSGGMDEVAAQLSEDRLRPYVYVPLNNRQLAAARAYWTTQGDAFGEKLDRSDPRLATLSFPPDKYDGFVLIGNGPTGYDGGLTSIGPPGIPGEDYNEHYTYHWLGLRIAFLASRDWPGPDSAEPDKLLDFDYRDRKMAALPHALPDGTNGPGAFIKVVQ